jgi:hypothetical protein
MPSLATAILTRQAAIFQADQYYLTWSIAFSLLIRYAPVVMGHALLIGFAISGL